jgi:hypothetical protein
MISEIDRGRIGLISWAFGNTVMSKVAQLLLPFAVLCAFVSESLLNPGLTARVGTLQGADQRHV